MATPYPGMDPEYLKSLQAMIAAMGPSATDKDAAKYQGLLAMGLGLMGARKGQEFAAAGNAGLLGLDARNRSLAQATAEKGAGLNQAINAQQLQGAMQAQADQKRMREILAGSDTAPQAAPPMGAPTGAASMQAAPATGQATPAVPDKKAAAARLQAIGDKLTAGGFPDKAQPYYDAAQKLIPQFKEDKTYTQNGKRIVVRSYTDGSSEVLPYSPDLEKAHFVNEGGRTTARDPFTAAQIGAAIPMSQSPDSKAANALGWANFGLSKEANARAAANQGANEWETNIERGIQVNKRTGETRPITSGGAPIGNAAELKKTQQAGGALAIIDQAEPIIKKATGSYIGTGVDAAAQLFGASTKGANATAQLQALEGALMLAQPRMEGPQSDKDTALYKQMAGKIGDPTVPQSQKLAALKVIREMHKRYVTSQSVTVDY